MKNVYVGRHVCGIKILTNQEYPSVGADERHGSECGYAPEDQSSSQEKTVPTDRVGPLYIARG